MNSIKSKIVLFVAVVMVILPLAFTLYFIRRHYALGERVAGNVEETFQVLNSTIVRDLRNAMLANQISGMRESLLSLKSFQHIQDAFLLDSEGNVVMDEEGAFIARGMRKLPDELQGSALRDAYAKARVQLQVEKSRNALLYRYLVPFKNEKECRGCHGTLAKTNGVLVLHFQIPDVRGQTHRLTFITFSFYLAAIAFTSFWLLFLIQKTVVSPLREMQSAMQEVSEGNLRVQIPVKRVDEIGGVSRFFNEMVRKLQASHEELEKSVREKERAQRLAEVGMMASRVAHEVRNPLNVLEGVAYYLKKAYSGEQDIVEHASLIQHKVEHLERFSTELLLFAKPEQLNRENVDVNALITRTVRESLECNREKKVRVSLRLDPALPPLSLDNLKICGAFANIIQNAYDASPEGAEITVSTRRKDSVVTVSVKDHGAGIPETQKENLFKPFFSTKKHGTGLGLCIVKKIVEAHGGEIKIVSDENKGTEAQIIFKGGSS